jgi:hypothetical protein
MMQDGPKWISFDIGHEDMTKHKVILVEYYSGAFQVVRISDHGVVFWYQVKQYQVLS